MKAPQIALGLLATAILGTVAGLIYEDVQRPSAHQRTRAFLAQHHCTKAGFAGQPPKPYYACDNGLWLINDIKRETR